MVHDRLLSTTRGKRSPGPSAAPACSGTLHEIPSCWRPRHSSDTSPANADPPSPATAYFHRVHSYTNSVRRRRRSVARAKAHPAARAFDSSYLPSTQDKPVVCHLDSARSSPFVSLPLILMSSMMVYPE